MKSRRNFFKTSIAALVLFAINRFGNRTKAAQINKVMPKSYIHQVYFWLKEPNSTDARTKMGKGLDMMDSIPQISQSYTGTPPDAERDVVDGSFTYSYLVIFENKEDHDIYQKHKTHLKFIEDCSDLWEKVRVYDSM